MYLERTDTMRTYLAIPVFLTIFVGLMVTQGCVARDEHDKLLAANRNSQDELSRALAIARDLRVKNEKLDGELASQGVSLSATQKEIEVLESANAALKSDFDELHVKYLALANRSDVPMPGAISILPAQLDKALKSFASANPDLVEYLPDYGMVKIKADLTFKPGSDFVEPSAKDALKKFADIVKSPAAAMFNIYVAGHTDDVPIGKPETRRHHPNNWYLSVHRAVAVQQQLVKSGLAPERIGAMGFGEYHPIEPNKAGKKGNQANRRVEIWIVPPDRFLTKVEAADEAK